MNDRLFEPEEMDPEDLKCFPDVVTKPSAPLKELVSSHDGSFDIWIKHLDVMLFFI